MPTFELDDKPVTDLDADVLAVFTTSEGEGDDASAVLAAAAQTLSDAMQHDLVAALAAVDHKGEAGSVARIPSGEGVDSALVLVVGLGPAADVDATVLRRGAGAAARAATRDASLAIAVPTDLLDAADATRAVAEGAGLGAYAFTAYRRKSPDAPALTSVTLIVPDAAAEEASAALAAAQAVVRGTTLVRDLVNTPPQDKRPPALADAVASAAREAGLEVEILDEAALRDGGFGGLLGVARGSSEEPRLVRLTYAPDGASGHVVLVGKGITFDSGGLSLKPSKAMETMKLDMAGAATVAGAMVALADLGVTTRVTGLLALAENMPGGDATRVSDVLTHRGGKTVEVMNTDAEGRLVLADALALASEDAPDAIVDLATLTGAQIVALGEEITAVLGSDQPLVDALRSAAEQTGEPLWQLPLHAPYADHLKSEVADLKNIGKAGQAGTIVAALFLKEFVGDGIPWAHLDIAGPSFSAEGDDALLSKGGTGVMVRTLLGWLAGR